MGNLITANKLPEFMTETNMYFQESLKASKSRTSILSRKLIFNVFLLKSVVVASFGSVLLMAQLIGSPLVSG